jgi:hypothetical protein
MYDDVTCTTNAEEAKESLVPGIHRGRETASKSVLGVTSLSLSLSLPLSLSRARARSLSPLVIVSHTCIHGVTHPQLLSESLTHTHTLSVSHILSYIHTWRYTSTKLVMVTHAHTHTHPQR